VSREFSIRNFQIVRKEEEQISLDNNVLIFYNYLRMMIQQLELEKNIFMDFLRHQETTILE